MVSWINRKGWPQPPTKHQRIRSWRKNRSWSTRKCRSRAGVSTNSIPYIGFSVGLDHHPWIFLDESPHHPSHPHQTKTKKQRNKQTNKNSAAKLLNPISWMTQKNHSYHNAPPSSKKKTTFRSPLARSWQHLQKDSPSFPRPISSNPPSRTGGDKERWPPKKTTEKTDKNDVFFSKKARLQNV